MRVCTVLGFESRTGIETSFRALSYRVQGGSVPQMFDRAAPAVS